MTSSAHHCMTCDVFAMTSSARHYAEGLRVTCDPTGLSRAVCQKYFHAAVSVKSVALSRRDGVGEQMYGWMGKISLYEVCAFKA
jgi:hypothetical protein